MRSIRSHKARKQQQAARRRNQQMVMFHDMDVHGAESADAQPISGQAESIKTDTTPLPERKIAQYH